MVDASQGMLPCPTCGYSLEGLGEYGVCPECGTEFTQEQLRVKATINKAKKNGIAHGAPWAFMGSTALIVVMIFGFDQWNAFVGIMITSGIVFVLIDVLAGKMHSTGRYTAAAVMSVALSFLTAAHTLVSAYDFAHSSDAQAGISILGPCMIMPLAIVAYLLTLIAPKERASRS